LNLGGYLARVEQYVHIGYFVYEAYLMVESERAKYGLPRGFGTLNAFYQARRKYENNNVGSKFRLSVAKRQLKKSIENSSKVDKNS